ncbi:MAG: cytochrome c oxidase assembly protein [Hyphomicrobiaceae bacterium]|nr:cytochrome c oxidase assembly protein [Hyphomicrobiaceae bacterium]
MGAPAGRQAADADATGAAVRTAMDRRHRSVATWCAAIVVAMVGLSYAAVPLYRLFCQVTGFGGTTQVASEPSTHVIDRPIRVRFDANVGPGLAWEFKPAQRTMDLKLGENQLASYVARNTSDRPLTGTASFNVSPEAAGVYFNKIECFCFTAQTLEPGQSIDMPVSFFIDPALTGDRNAAHITEITLSYTFYPIAKPSVSAGAASASNSGG